jgi:hypothetical protein
MDQKPCALVGYSDQKHLSEQFVRRSLRFPRNESNTGNLRNVAQLRAFGKYRETQGLDYIENYAI